RRAPATLVHASAERREITRHAPAIAAAQPAQPAEGVVPRRPLFLQQRFRLSVPNLLLPVRPKVAATMVPDDRRGGIADDLASVPEPPADVDVVPRGPESGVEPPDGFESAFPERHVASRNMLRNPIGNQDRVRPAGRVRDRVGPPSVIRWSEVRAADRGVVAFHEGKGEEPQPMRVRVRVVVDEGHDLSRGRCDPGVARATEALILLVDDPVWIGGGNLPGLVRGAVVHDDYFEGRIIQI